MSTLQPPMALLDRIAVFLSAVCLVHCFAVPFLVTLLPLVGSALLPDHAFHLLLLVMVLPTSLWALVSGCRRHGRLLVGATGTTGLIILTVVGLAGHEFFGVTGERIATGIGSVVVGLAHAMNYRLLRANGNARCSQRPVTGR